MGHSATINKSCQALKISDNDLNHLRPSTSHNTRTTRALVSLAAVLFAWRVGSQHDLALGVLSIAMAAGLELSSRSRSAQPLPRSGNGASSRPPHSHL